MHKLWRHPNGVYYVLYGEGLKRRVSTRETDRDPAEQFLSQFILRAAKGTAIEKGRLADLPTANLQDRNTVATVAAYWQCSPGAIYRLIRNGSLSCIKLGRFIRITREQVEDCEARHLFEVTHDDEVAHELAREADFRKAMETARRQKFPAKK